jgi:hypothetical protein
MAKKTYKEDVAKAPEDVVKAPEVVVKAPEQPVVVEKAKSEKELIVHESGQLGHYDDEGNFIPA